MEKEHDLKSMESTSQGIMLICSITHDIPCFFLFFRTCYSYSSTITMWPLLGHRYSNSINLLGMVLSAIESNNVVSRIGKGQRRISLLYTLLVYCSATHRYYCEYVHELTPVCS